MLWGSSERSGMALIECRGLLTRIRGYPEACQCLPAARSTHDATKRPKPRQLYTLDAYWKQRKREREGGREGGREGNLVGM